MPVGAWSTRVAAVAVCTLVACGGDRTTAPTPLELAIERTLAKRLGMPVGAHCGGVTCGALAVDGTLLTISLATTGAEVEWRVDGLLITAAELESYVRDEITELGAPQGVTCTLRVRRVVAGDRIACALERGGIVFVTVRADGTTSLETLLDPEAAKIRSALVTPEIEEELARASRALEATEEADEDSEDVGQAGELLAPDASR